jgi:multidrug resistance efflux pump
MVCKGLKKGDKLTERSDNTMDHCISDQARRIALGPAKVIPAMKIQKVTADGSERPGTFSQLTHQLKAAKDSQPESPRRPVNNGKKSRRSKSASTAKTNKSDAKPGGNLCLIFSI